MSDFLNTKFGLGRESQVCTLMLNFIVVAVKCAWTYSPQIAKNSIFLYKLAPKGKLWGSTEKVEYRRTTTNLPACNDTIIVLKITLIHSVSVITNFVIPKRDRQKHRTFSSTGGARPTISTILGTVIEEVRTIFAPQLFFDPISSFGLCVFRAGGDADADADGGRGLCVFIGLCVDL